MAGESGKRRDEAVYRYYKCSGVKRKLGCDKKTVRKSWIEDLVVEEIKRLVHDDETAAYIANCVMEVQGRENPNLEFRLPMTAPPLHDENLPLQHNRRR